MTDVNRFVGKHHAYPDLTGCRLAEGGRRLNEDIRKSSPDAPLITIITVCWNSAKTIAQTIQSVRDQTYQNIEYIIVDGASTDGTVDILRAHEKFIDYYVSEPDDGLYYAMNKGLKLAQGEHILILNSDDWYSPDCVSSLIAAKSFSGCDFVSALALYVDEEAGTSQPLRSMPFDHSQYFRMSLRHEAMLIPAALYEKVGDYDTQYRILSDRDFTARLFQSGATVHEIPHTLLMFRTSGVSNTNTKLLNQERETLLQLRFPFLTADERRIINDVGLSTPSDIIDIANRHIEHTDFVKACRALLADRKKTGAKKWRSANLGQIGEINPELFPKVSVILPFYEAAESIERAITSVLGQTLEDLELICVNDCAIDQAESIVSEYVKRDSRVKLIRNASNMGLGASRNAGVRAANGQYVFHLDPDDTLPLSALEKLYEAAIDSGAVMVKGAYSAAQGLHEQQALEAITKYPCGISDKVITNANLQEMPKLLATTEGHWSFLYDANFARQVPYPTDLKMGQDSIFLVNAIARAPSITLIPDIVYNYEANPASTMNRFTARKFYDALEWRRRAWHVLNERGYKQVADNMMLNYWGGAFFDALEEKLGIEEQREFYKKMRSVFSEVGLSDAAETQNEALRKRLPDIFPIVFPGSENKGNNGPLRVAIFSTRDHGGAGMGSQRRARALRLRGVNAQIYSLFKNTEKLHVHRVPASRALDVDKVRAELEVAWKKQAVVTRQEYPNLKARELFSKTGSLVDFNDFRDVFEGADIVHMHWVVGLFDYVNASRLLADKPVVWTLADMNAFTGGCHYSEGCTEFIKSCLNCPLLGSGDGIAGTSWSVKKNCYDGLKNLHIICPSQWMADQVKASALFGHRPVHVIPNALPVDRFRPTNKLAARQKLGLPLNKKLVVFGADSLNNNRKGGDLLQQAFVCLKEQGALQNVEGVVFGSKSLNLGVKTHSMGRVNSETELSLIYASADVFAFPSREDNAPLTVAESLLSGTPVVAFPVGNVSEIVNHLETGYIAESQNIKDFANGLRWALENVSRQETILRSIRCHETARQYNDPDLAAQRHIHLYKSILEASRAGAQAAAKF